MGRISVKSLSLTAVVTLVGGFLCLNVAASETVNLSGSTFTSPILGEFPSRSQVAWKDGNTPVMVAIQEQPSHALGPGKFVEVGYTSKLKSILIRYGDYTYELPGTKLPLENPKFRLVPSSDSFLDIFSFGDRVAVRFLGGDGGYSNTMLIVLRRGVVLGVEHWSTEDYRQRLDPEGDLYLEEGDGLKKIVDSFSKGSR